jgi:hypothetical protein
MQNIPKSGSMIVKGLFKASLIFFSVFIVSCKSSIKKEPKTTNIAEDIGFIMSTETTNNDYFENERFYFIPAKEIDSIKPTVSFKERNLKQGYGFCFYSRCYIQLVNSMVMIYSQTELNGTIEILRTLT